MGAVVKTTERTFVKFLPQGLHPCLCTTMGRDSFGQKLMGIVPVRGRDSYIGLAPVTGNSRMRWTERQTFLQPTD